jgi:hypothetical protein
MIGFWLCDRAKSVTGNFEISCTRLHIRNAEWNRRTTTLNFMDWTHLVCRIRTGAASFRTRFFLSFDWILLVNFSGALSQAWRKIDAPTLTPSLRPDEFRAAQILGLRMLTDGIAGPAPEREDRAQLNPPTKFHV